MNIPTMNGSCAFWGKTMKTKLEKVKLNNGVKMPSLGIGTWQIPDSEDLVSSLESAIRLGYRYLDTAAIYENEG